MKNIFLTLSFILFALAANAVNEQTNEVLGQYPMSSNLPTSEGYAKVVITSTPEFTDRFITLLNQDTVGGAVRKCYIHEYMVLFYT